MILKSLLALTLLMATAHAQSLKVLSYNIYRKPEPFGFGGSHAAKRVKRLCLELAKTDYDVVLLQEAWLAKDRKRLEKCGFPYVVNIGTKVPSRLPGRAAANHREQNLESGLLILSRHKVIDSGRYEYKLDGSLWSIFKDGEKLASKAAYFAKIEAHGHSLWFVNTHLAANYCKTYPRIDCNSYEALRESQLEELSALVAKLDGPVVMGGDFNMGPSPISRDMAWLRFDDYFPGFAQANHDPAQNSTSSILNNFNFYDMGKIDHLFGSSDLRLSQGELVFTQLMNIQGRSLHLSDHFGWQSVIHFD
ncbi:MAG: hypothetical protein CME71_04400 [Halobacteriovorax sp.]|nr:hypothetical protein [Halobacteriovorax sp.]